jgi:hypothetical protein
MMIQLAEPLLKQSQKIWFGLHAQRVLARLMPRLKLLIAWKVVRVNP